jgi:hypothetical protein
VFLVKERPFRAALDWLLSRASALALFLQFVIPTKFARQAAHHGSSRIAFDLDFTIWGRFTIK